ncbi:MAG: alpha/beta hydrolase family protein [Nitrososphaerales archaeon]
MAENEPQGASIEVNWPLDGTTVYATLLRPQRGDHLPAAVMVAGSGPTDRDWNSPLLPGTNGSARLLAEGLAGRGFASLRYDKRVAGPHGPENYAALAGKVSFQSHVDELAGAVRFLAGQDFVDPARIFALTNSEGAFHALNYQVHDPQTPFAGLVLIAPPGRVMSEVGRGQIAAQVAPLPNGSAILAAYDEQIARFEAGEPVALDPALPQGVQMLLQGLSAPGNQPFARELWMADTTPWLAQVTVPVLVVIGKKDIQVDWQADGGRLQQAVAGHNNVEFVFPENANHVLKYEPVPRAELTAAEATPRYNELDTVLDPKAEAVILEWLAAHS